MARMDKFGSEIRSKIMSCIKSKDTRFELKVRRALHRLGFRYRLHDSKLPGKPDLVFPKYNSAIQLRGCFWHSHHCRDGHIPKSNKSYWVPKLKRTKERDVTNDKKLVELGWRIFVVWECECNTYDKLESKIQEIVHFLNRTDEHEKRCISSRA